MFVTCHCKHSKDSHEVGGLSCTLCECTLYRPATTDDPFKNNLPARTIRLLAMARESEYPKTRKLGARIEEMLGELEMLSEQELAYKAEVARQEKERETAMKVLEEARANLAKAEQAVAQFLPPKKAATKRSRSFTDTEKKPCPTCGKRFVNVGAHHRLAHTDAILDMQIAKEEKKES